MSIETTKPVQETEEIKGNAERMRKRVDFQRYLMLEMGVKHGDQKSEMDWINNYAKLVGDIIDSKISCASCANIKELIDNKEYKKAAKMIKPELEDLIKVKVAA